ncbi:DNA-3-methyladenine glycosylase [Okibacterium fritillariae]|uniref:Putative 3-methyladenine DNA glycosylase n=1 Tax=Okibacterium fritillariae TaxID=123320 RepID=A0A1T5JG26_9MICO|nr:DNA-3-methyladenine glycosylase [Okibacterium fritillariae]SKC50306.1 DNA-3-methyladenine glycosylase [Okibacterium fritillariae]
MRASRSFFARDALEVAPELLGAHLTISSPDGDITVRITETEAYHGLGTGKVHDAGSHARMGKTARNATMFGEPGHLYVYFSYGMHNAVNVACSPEGVASGVLLRAGEIVAGEELARSRRPAAKTSRDLARGPGRLAQALGLVYTLHDGMDALSDTPLQASGSGGPRGPEHAGDERPLDPRTRAHLELPDVPPQHISSGPRTGVSGEAGSEAFPWRFWITDDPTVSPYRPAAPRTARRAPST